MKKAESAENRSRIRVLYLDEKKAMICTSDRLFFVCDGHPYWISSHPYEPSLFLNTEKGKQIVIHNAFDMDEIDELVQTKERKRSLSGNPIGIEELCELLAHASETKHDLLDLPYLEGLRVISLLRKASAYGKENAVDISSFGIVNTKIMNPFLHSKQVFKDEKGSYYL